MDEIAELAQDSWLGLRATAQRRSHYPFDGRQGQFEEAARYAVKLPAAEAVPCLLKLNKVEEARELARQFREKQVPHEVVSRRLYIT